MLAVFDGILKERKKTKKPEVYLELVNKYLNGEKRFRA